MSERQELKRVLDRNKADLMALPNVVGVGFGYKTVKDVRTIHPCVVVLVRRKLALHALPQWAVVPQSVDGAITDVVQVGDVRALHVRTDKFRPAPGGVSIGHYAITAGTLGCLVQDVKTGMPLILSNNHVLANSNNAAIGDAILQPGPADGGTLEDTIAELLRFEPVQFGALPGDCGIASSFALVANTVAILLGSKHRLRVTKEDPLATNLVDCAVAMPLSSQDVTVGNHVLDIGEVAGTLEAELGMPVRKSGRTTELNEGEITVLDATISVGYGGVNVATFEDQIITTAMAQGGDSGSLLVAADAPKGVGLLFAGSDQVAIHNKIGNVLDALDVTFWT